MVMPTRITKKPTAEPAPGKPPARRPRQKSPPNSQPSHKYLSGNALVCADILDILQELALRVALTSSTWTRRSTPITTTWRRLGTRGVWTLAMLLGKLKIEWVEPALY